MRNGPHPAHVDRHGKLYGQRARGMRAVLLAVADAANADGDNAYPGLANVMKFALYSRRQAIDLLDELVAEGWLQVQQQGGGRGLATVYRVVLSVERNSAATAPVAEPETVQRPRRNSAARTRETVRCAAETVQPGLHPNVLATELLNVEPNASADADAAPDPARALVTAFWQWCTEHQHPVPTLPTSGHGNAFMALVAIVRRLLDAGWAEVDVKRALTVTPVYSLNGLTLQLQQARQQRGSQRAGAPTMARTSGSGVVTDL